MIKIYKLCLAFVLISNFSKAQVPNNVPSNGLVGWWPFNGNAIDESINSHDGQVIGNNATLTIDRFGMANKAYNFSGGYGFIQIPDANDLSFPNEVFTFSFWLKLLPFNNTSALGVISKGVNAVNNEYSVYYSYSTVTQNKLVFIPKSPTTGCIAIDNSYTYPTLSVWHHYVYICNGTSGSQVYVDGQLAETRTDMACGMGNGTGNLYFGKTVDYYPNNSPGNQFIDRYLQGVLDDVAFWNRPLDICEIQALYGSGNINAGSDISICAGSSVTLNGSGGSNYIWNNGVVDGMTFSPASSGVFALTGTDTNGCFGTDTVNINVNALPTVNAGADQTVCAGTAVTLSGAGANTYSWNNGVNNGVSFNPTVSNEYIVTGTDVNGCMGTDTVNVTVNNPSNSTLTETALDSYTLNGQTYTQSGTYTQVIPNAAGCDSTITLNLSLDFTGINETQTGFSIAPNPTIDIVTITSTDALYDEYVLFDPQGRKVLSGTLTGTTTQLDLSRLSRGNYLLQIGEKKTLIKLIKQ